MSETHIKIIASKLFSNVHIESFGSLERDYKVDNILFKINTLILKGDYIRTLLLVIKFIKII